MNSVSKVSNEAELGSEHEASAAERDMRRGVDSLGAEAASDTMLWTVDTGGVVVPADTTC